MELTAENYYSVEANKEYVSVSQFKQFFGTYGMRGCEFTAMEELEGRWSEEPSEAMLVGSYVDSYFEGQDAFEEFKRNTPQLFTQKGGLRAAYSNADNVIARCERDEFFMTYLSGQKQVIMTGEIAGAKFKIKMDSYTPGVAIVDLKTVKSITKHEWVKDMGYLSFIEYWGYDTQGAVYQEIVRQNTGEKLPFYIAAVTKDKEPDIQVIQVDDHFLKPALKAVETAIPRLLRVKNKEAEPDRCEACPCCRHNRILTKPITIADLKEMADI